MQMYSILMIQKCTDACNVFWSYGRIYTTLLLMHVMYKFTRLLYNLYRCVKMNETKLPLDWLFTN